MRGMKRSTAQWQDLFEAYEQSGLSAAAFCRERSLPAPYFRTKYRKSKHSNDTSPFSAVRVTSPAAQISLLVDNVQIRCDDPVPTQWLAGLVQQLWR